MKPPPVIFKSIPQFMREPDMPRPFSDAAQAHERAAWGIYRAK